MPKRSSDSSSGPNRFLVQSSVGERCGTSRQAIPRGAETNGTREGGRFSTHSASPRPNRRSHPAPSAVERSGCECRGEEPLGSSPIPARIARNRSSGRGERL
ncbi:MAG TPA: hypothetical protein DCQ98_05425 [Planctomycetaceae bacterium]|nr:hypothetical protein [Planctomycetaceae bacterium]